jgi:propionyl-CoA carboxylase beta chain
MANEDPRILELRRMRAKALEGGGRERIAKQKAKGKMTARERVEALLDPGTFHELEPFITPQADELGLAKETFHGDGVITGFGQIHGRTVYVYSQDYTIHGGTLSEVQAHKICRVMDLAAQSGSPIIALIDSGGARIQEGVRSMGGYAEVFRRNVQYSGVVPQISITLGPCAGGAAYSPSLTDLVIMVEKQSFMFLTGPDVIREVTGELIDAESLGGADVHMTVSGVAHLSVKSEKEAFDAAKRFLSYLPANNVENPPYFEPTDAPSRMDQALNSIVPLDPSEPYTMRAVIETIVDHNTFLEIHSGWARNAIVGLARLGGFSAGIVAQEPAVMAGVIDIDASDKMTRFVRMCDCFNIPLVTFVDSPGFLPGVAQEHGGIIRHGAKLLYAYSEAVVPKICIITRKAYGGAYIVMSSKYLGTDVTYAWPSAEIAVLGAESAANILFKKQIESSDNPEEERRRLADEYRRKFNNPFYAAATGYVDDIIEPKETRPKIIAALSALRDKSAPSLPRKHGNMPV